MKSSKGFTLTETLVATSIIFIMIGTILPIATLLHSEQDILADRRSIASHLHDELQSVIHDKHSPLPDMYTEKINNKNIRFQFKQNEENFIKGCATWQNGKQIEEEICLYGYDDN
ncbi:prepilin-type N-terminal cleavage/methylation domain-containing protein [Virgibacillus sp. W0181]|uniref:prepilin-type N-terminal cleavage/methylation domain-containing protein n=1 Tax=Virgibacillus sp. W0181 TaxID=3391581 RepID=UPI003F465400